MKVVILGCGGSDGVPRIGGADGAGDWGACDPANPKNRRTRSAVYVEAAGTRLLIDTPPDLREQLLANRISAIDAVLYTHEHADHSHGIHEARRLSAILGGLMPVYGSAATLDDLQTRFSYLFTDAADGGYRAVARPIPIDGPFAIGGATVVPFDQDHGFGTRTLGFRIGDFAYSTDVIGLPEASLAALDGVKLWMVDCVQEEPHATHAHLDLALSWIERVRPARAVLTHLSGRLDYETLRAKCPAGVEPGYDGMELEL